MDWSMPDFPPLLSPWVCSNSCPLSWWCHPTISSSVATFYSCPQSFPASGSFPMSWLFASGGQKIGASASALVLPMDILGWFPLELTSLISLLSKRLSRVFSSITIQKHQFFGTQPPLLLGEISTTSDIADETILMAESEEGLKSFLMRAKEESEKAGLKLSIQNTRIMASSPITSWLIDGGKVETEADYHQAVILLLLCCQCMNSCK